MKSTIRNLSAAVAAVALMAAYFHPTQYAPYTFQNTIVRLHFDFDRGIVYGDETAIVRPKHRVQTLPFNTFQIHYDRITVNGRDAAYDFDDPNQLVNVKLSAPADAGTTLRVDFHYWAKPQRGVFFDRPDKGYPDITPEIFTQGEPTDNRRWFPTWDEPNQKTPSELVITVPSGWTAVSNGSLKSHTHSQSADVWDWSSPEPKSTYLIAFAAGPLVKWHSSLGSLDVDSFVQPQYANLNALCFHRTKDMIAYYDRIIGVQYPFAKYDQITAQRFDFGGMEDESSTILTSLLLHPAVEDVENSCDNVISHEMAQHWFGDDVTMADWSNTWINEGFATYYDELWTSEEFGEPDFEYARYQAQQQCLASTEQTPQPIVNYVYNDPLELIGVSSHQCPAEALHMLRTMFGDARFFGALRDYLREYTYKNADTNQFFAAIGKSLGTDLSWFKNEWFYRSYYPHYVVTDSYDPSSHILTLHVKQQNAGKQPFSMPIAIEALYGGHVAKIQPVIDRNDQVVTISGVASRPDIVLFDPNNNVLRQLTFAKSIGELTYQLHNASHVSDREWALSQLAADAHARGQRRSIASSAVAQAVLHDPFWGIRNDAVAIAASFGDTESVLGALKDRDVRVRMAAENAAGSLHGQPAKVITELEKMTNDPNPDVASAALASLGALHAPGIFNRLVAALGEPSFQGAIAGGALSGLAAYGDERSCELIRTRTAYGVQEQERDAAVTALAQCAMQMKQPQLAIPVLSNLALHDPLISTRLAAAGAFSILHDAAANPVLEEVERTDSQELIRETAQGSIVTQKSK